MRFSIQLPTDRVDRPDEFLTARAVGRMASAVEAAGFDAGFVTDHPIPDDTWLAGGGHHTLDPFVALAFAAAATSRLRLQLHVLVLPYRNPFLAAKSIASLDVLSGGRVTVGVAAGYLEGEFAALGVDIAERNELCDEGIETMRAVWSRTGLALEGRGWSCSGNTALPHPIQSPPPIWVGGNSKRAIRRAVALGDGWLPFHASKQLASRIRTAPLHGLEDLASRIAYAREQAAATSRTRPLDICFPPSGLAGRGRPDGFDPDQVLESADALEGLGVTWCVVGIPAESCDEYCERVARFGRQVLSQRPGATDTTR